MFNNKCVRKTMQKWNILHVYAELHNTNAWTRWNLWSILYELTITICMYPWDMKTHIFNMWESGLFTTYITTLIWYGMGMTHGDSTMAYSINILKWSKHICVVRKTKSYYLQDIWTFPNGREWKWDLGTNPVDNIIHWHKISKCIV